MAVRTVLMLTGAIALAGWQANAQTTVVAENAAPQQTAAPVSGPYGTLPVADVPALKVRPKPEEKVKKGKKDAYTGPNTIVELAPTPMLDEQGIQRLDPDGKPMWNAPVKQQRDKHGHPLFDDNGKPVFQTASDLGFDEHGKKIKVKKEKEPKKIPLAIVRGTMTVDGMTGKAALNYDIADLKYIYLYAPGIGVAVVSNEPFPGAVEQKNAFTNNTLTVNVAEHTLQLASEKSLLGKKSESAYVLMDRTFTLPSRFPVIGYGTLRKAPYQWPGARPNGHESDVADFAPPPPADLLPTAVAEPVPGRTDAQAGTAGAARTDAGSAAVRADQIGSGNGFAPPRRTWRKMDPKR